MILWLISDRQTPRRICLLISHVKSLLKSLFTFTSFLLIK